MHSRNEHTIAAACQISGRGYWTGKEVCIQILPAAVGTGVRLVRSDLPSQPFCEVLAQNRSDAHLRTIVQVDGARFEMVEHLMAALAALEIDNCIVEINGAEFPGLDGSSLPYVEALQKCGLIVQAKPRQQLVLDHTLRVEAEGRWLEARPSASGKSEYEYRLEFDNHAAISNQCYSFACTPSSFARNVAPARTFVTKQQAESLQAQGVASHVTYRDLLVFDLDGPIDNQLRFENECARHKVLDLIGDLALVGVDLVGRFVSYRGGHSLNGQLASKLYEMACRRGVQSTQSQRAA